jgi:hypothetical protein
MEQYRATITYDVYSYASRPAAELFKMNWGEESIVRSFIDEMHKFILEDKILINFLDKYSTFIFGKVLDSYIKENLGSNIYSSLFREFYSQHIFFDRPVVKAKYNKVEFYYQLVSIAHERLKYTIFKKTKQLMGIIPRFNDSKEELAFRRALLTISSLEFDKAALFNKIEGWKSPWGLPAPKETPNFRTVEYFDPIIYKILLENPILLKTLEWRVFEEMLADILRRFGYQVELTKPTKDGGIDIIAIKKEDNFGEHKYLLQAKRYNKSVQVSPVRELLFLHDEYKATKSCLATTATFTKGAWQLADQHRWKLELKDHLGILDWIKTVVNQPL